MYAFKKSKTTISENFVKRASYKSSRVVKIPGKFPENTECFFLQTCVYRA